MERLSMNSCMVGHATQHNQDAAREEWFATRLERQRLREEKERKRKEQEKFYNEWWGINKPEQTKEGQEGQEGR
ncbi:MAG: hypothetical protein M1812_003489 [Candelaria pacifica]|nr:MAG: hypothetical protein M1812_003489 [Candelaria pacifica]